MPPSVHFCEPVPAPKNATLRPLTASLCRARGHPRGQYVPISQAGRQVPRGQRCRGPKGPFRARRDSQAPVSVTAPHSHTHALSHTRTHMFDHTVPPAQVLGAIDVTPSENAGQPRARTRPLPETPGKLKPPGFGSGSSRVLPETPRPRPQPAPPLAAQVPPTGCPESPAPSPAPLSPSSVSQAGLQFSEGGHGPPTRPCH